MKLVPIDFPVEDLLCYCTYVCVCLHACVPRDVCVFARVCAQGCVCVYMCVCAQGCACVFAHVCAQGCVCVCVCTQCMCAEEVQRTVHAEAGLVSVRAWPRPSTAVVPGGTGMCECVSVCVCVSECVCMCTPWLV